MRARSGELQKRMRGKTGSLVGGENQTGYGGIIPGRGTSGGKGSGGEGGNC